MVEEAKTITGECFDSNGNYMRAGFYCDKKGKLVHMMDREGSWRFGEFVPNGPRLSFCGEGHSSVFATRDLTLIEDPLKYVEEHEWAHKEKWTPEDIEEILKYDEEVAEFHARLEEEKRGEN